MGSSPNQLQQHEFCVLRLVFVERLSIAGDVSSEIGLNHQICEGTKCQTLDQRKKGARNKRRT